MERMAIDEAIELHKKDANILTNEANKQIAVWLEKLKTIENIMVQYLSDWYFDEDNGVPDCAILEAIWNVIMNNGLDIYVEQDYRKGVSDGYNKAIDDFVTQIHKLHDDFSKDGDFSTLYYWFGRIDSVAEQLKRGGEDDNIYFGQTVYKICTVNDESVDFEYSFIQETSYLPIYKNEIGESIFLTKQDAENKLKDLKRGGKNGNAENNS